MTPLASRLAAPKIATLLAATALAAVGLLAALPHANATQIRIGTEADDAPFESIGPDGKPVGFDIDLGDALCRQAKLDCVWVNMDFDGLIPALDAHRIDAVMSEMTVTPERAKRVLFTSPVTSTAAMVVVRSGSSITDDPRTTRGKTIGVQSGTTEETYARKVLAPFATIRAYDTQLQAFADLNAGRIDATICDQGVGYDWLKQHAGRFVFAGDPINDPAIIGNGTAIAVRRDDDALKTKFDKALAAILANHEYAAINAKYFPFKIGPAGSNEGMPP